MYLLKKIFKLFSKRLIYLNRGLAKNKFSTSESFGVRSTAPNETKFVLQTIPMMRLSFIKLKIKNNRIKKK